LSDVPLSEVLSKRRLAGLAQSIGMQEIIRWTPKDVRFISWMLMLELTMSSYTT